METNHFTYEVPKLRGIFPIPEILVKEGYDTIGDTFAIIKDPNGSKDPKLCFVGHSAQEEEKNKILYTSLPELREDVDLSPSRMIDFEIERGWYEREEEWLLGKVKQKFPFLFKRYPIITLIDKFIVKHILHINRYVTRTDCSVPYRITEYIKLTYRYLFSKKGTSIMTQTQDMVFNAVMDVVLRRKEAHRVPECALRSEVTQQINDYFPHNNSDMPSHRQTDDALQWLVKNGYLKATPAVNEMTYYVLPPQPTATNNF